MQKFFNKSDFEDHTGQLFQIPLIIPSFMKRGNWSHLGYSNTPYVLWKKLEWRVGFVAKVWRLVVLGKCWQHTQAGSTFARTNVKTEIYTTVFYTGCEQLCYYGIMGCDID